MHFKPGSVLYLFSAYRIDLAFFLLLSGSSLSATLAEVYHWIYDSIASKIKITVVHDVLCKKECRFKKLDALTYCQLSRRRTCAVC
jgi:hypothetical protein